MPQSTPAALLVIDMLLDDYRAGPLAEQREALVDSLNLLLAEFRSRGLPIILLSPASIRTPVSAPL